MSEAREIAREIFARCQALFSFNGFSFAVRGLFEFSVRVPTIMSDQLNEVRSALLQVADRLSALQKASPQGK